MLNFNFNFKLYILILVFNLLNRKLKSGRCTAGVERWMYRWRGAVDVPLTWSGGCTAVRQASGGCTADMKRLMYR